MRYVDELDSTDNDDFLTVIIPEFALEHWWQQLLHNQSALVLRTRLRNRPNTIVTSVPFHVPSVANARSARPGPDSVEAPDDEPVH